MYPTDNEIQKKLLSYFGREFPSRENLRISDLTRISDGWENDVYSFTTRYEKAEERKCEDLILRIYPGDDAPHKSAREFNAMKRLHELNFPVPKVLLLELDNSPFGKPFVVMEKIDGRSMGTVADESPDEKKQELLTLFCKMFVELHTLDWRPFAPVLSLSIEDPRACVRRELSQAQSYFQAFQKHEFDPVLDWLRERSSDIRWERLSVIHGDYHPFNILLRDDGSAFVIDWTNVSVSDFRNDLAWTLLLMSTYGNPEVRDTVLGEYERIAGYRIEQIKYFEVAASLRRLFSISVSLSHGANKLGMRPGAETLMKQKADHVKNVYALLRERTGIAIPEVEMLLSTLS